MPAEAYQSPYACTWTADLLFDNRNLCAPWFHVNKKADRTIAPTIAQP